MMRPCSLLVRFACWLWHHSTAFYLVMARDGGIGTKRTVWLALSFVLGQKIFMDCHTHFLLYRDLLRFALGFAFSGGCNWNENLGLPELGFVDILLHCFKWMIRYGDITMAVMSCFTSCRPFFSFSLLVVRRSARHAGRKYLKDCLRYATLGCRAFFYEPEDYALLFGALRRPKIFMFLWFGESFTLERGSSFSVYFFLSAGFQWLCRYWREDCAVRPLPQRL